MRIRRGFWWGCQKVLYYVYCMVGLWYGGLWYGGGLCYGGGFVACSTMALINGGGTAFPICMILSLFDPHMI